MASDDVLLKMYTQFLDQNFGENDKNTCEKGFKMKDHLGVLITELKSAQLIIKILQEEIKSKCTGPVPGIKIFYQTVLSVNPMKNITPQVERTVCGRKFGEINILQFNRRER
jgi:hypothetical protein